MYPAASEALLVIINTKSFQKQQQPQFPKEKKKEPEDQNYDQFWTQQFHYPNQYTVPAQAGSLPVSDWRSLPTFKMADGFLTSSLVRLNCAPSDVTRPFPLKSLTPSALTAPQHVNRKGNATTAVSVIFTAARSDRFYNVKKAKSYEANFEN